MYEMYEDGAKDAEGGLLENRENNEIPVMYTGLKIQIPITEMNDNYVDYSFIFPKGKKNTREKVIGRKIDASGNAVDRRDNNPILDMNKYCVDFDDGEVRELKKILIAESMYAACPDSGDE